MQTLDVISINIWQIIVSLLNLVILFLIIKKFLYNPVRKMLDARQQTIDAAYSDADRARKEALLDKQAYEQKLSEAKSEADSVIKSAVDSARERENEIIAKAKSEADGIVRQAKENAELEIKKAQSTIKSEIVDVSTILTEKLLEREIKPEDHRNLIDSFIDEIGDAQ
ncbi:MAG: F0F1 ATP synthase subunit B [Oscillospiraceae bacterium]|nr:F0F1 ATP synthase subunit B [Oscillospiraceae bacterium]